ncbi:hypothetical protein [Baaleninema simplex]|uniref:hypothetical protein n=1 Tax=Baaleninema simplex TaxID=2862350 RepID=UPI00037F342C|nr:hypothetical protein [Baaleninema simplex]
MNIIIVASSTFLLVSYLVIQKKQSDIKKGKIPKILQQFPMHTSSQEEYASTRLKIDEFFSLCLNNKQSKLKLNQAEINDIYTQGVCLDKYKPGRYIYYEIQDDKIIENMIEWPAFGPAFTLCYFEKKEIWFSSQKKIVEHLNILEVQEKSLPKDEVQRPIQRSALIVFIFGGSISPYGFTDFSKTVQYQKAEKILERLKKVEIKNGILIIESQGN